MLVLITVYCRCPKEELSIENKVLTLCIGPGSTPCECTELAGHCVVSEYIHCTVHTILNSSNILIMLGHTHAFTHRGSRTPVQQE